MLFSYSSSFLVRVRCRFCKSEPTFHYLQTDKFIPRTLKPALAHKNPLWNHDISHLLDPKDCLGLSWLGASLGSRQKLSPRRFSIYKRAIAGKNSLIKAIITCQ